MLILAVVSGWAIVLPNLIASIAIVCGMMLFSRQRRWRDRKLLSKAIVLPDEYVNSERRTVRDMEIGEEGYIDGSAVVTSKRTHRVFVDWSAPLGMRPEKLEDPFSPLRVRRLERGFSITVRPSDRFRTGSIPWGWYAPVIEILQADAWNGQQRRGALR